MPDPAGLPRVTPSKPDEWSGTRQDGEIWTVEQRRVIADDNEFRRKRHDNHRVRAERHVPGRWMPETVFIDCPILATNPATGNHLIVTPAGFKKWVKP